MRKGLEFRTKLFLAVTLTAGVVSTLAVLITHRAISRLIVDSYQSRYQSQALGLGKSIQAIDSATEETLRNALEALKGRIRSEGIPASETLKNWKSELSVSDVGIARFDGLFIRASDYDVSNLKVNLFGFCSEYRKLSNGSSALQRTPLLPSSIDGRVRKFSLAAMGDKRLILNVSKEVTFIREIFETTLANDPNVDALALTSPSGFVLGKIDRAGGFSYGGAPVSVGSQVEPAPGLTIETAFAANAEDCCECRAKGVTGPDGVYTYRLRMSVSRRDLDQSLAWLKNAMLLVLAVCIAAGAALGSRLSNRLSASLNAVNAKTEELLKSNDPDKRLNLPGSDEITRISGRFDALLDRLQMTQDELAEQRKRAALAEVAEQTAHDIRSPLGALKVLASRPQPTPEDWQLLSAATDRIAAIADGLIRLNRSQRTPQADQRGTRSEIPSAPIQDLVTAIVREKRAALEREPTAPKIELGFLNCETCSVIADPDELSRVLSNLIQNAIEAVDAEGTVQVRAFRSGADVILQIIDSGHGMSPETLGRLGQKGFSTKRDHSSSGQGLGVYHAIQTVAQWGGQLSFDSELSKGTTVTLKLSCAV